MNIVLLAEHGEPQLLSNDLLFQDKVERALAFLRSMDILPIERATQNGFLHTRFAAMIVSAFDQFTSIDFQTRRHGDLCHDGQSTLVIKWLDEAVSQNVLKPQNEAEKAKGDFREVSSSPFSLEHSNTSNV